MNRADEHRKPTFEVQPRATEEPDPVVRNKWTNLLKPHMRLANHSENETMGPTYDPVWNLLNQTGPNVFT
jgi:hypothetical protein